MPLSFSKCGKKAKDLLKKGYEWDRTVTLKTKTPSGVKYTTTGKLDGAKKGDMKGSFEASYKHPSGFEIKKLAVDSNHNFDAEIRLSEQAEGVDFFLNVKVTDFSGPGDKEKSVVGVDYTNKAMNLSCSAETDPSKDFQSAMSALIGYEAFNFGFSAAGKLSADKEGKKAPALSGWSTKMGYTMKKDAELCLEYASKGEMNFGVLHNYSKDTTFATTIKYTPAEQKTFITAGGKYCLDPETTFQAMVDNNALLSLSYAQYLRPMVKLTTSAKVDMKFVNNGASGSAAPTKFGFGLELGDI